MNMFKNFLVPFWSECFGIIREMVLFCSITATNLLCPTLWVFLVCHDRRTHLWLSPWAPWGGWGLPQTLLIKALLMHMAPCTRLSPIIFSSQSSCRHRIPLSYPMSGDTVRQCYLVLVIFPSLQFTGMFRSNLHTSWGQETYKDLFLYHPYSHSSPISSNTGTCYPAQWLNWHLLGAHNVVSPLLGVPLHTHTLLGRRE